MNKDLKYDFYKLPEELLDKLNGNLKVTSDKANGYERLSNLCKNKGVNYGQAKKIKHEMENGLNPEAYKLVGGDELLRGGCTTAGAGAGTGAGVGVLGMKTTVNSSVFFLGWGAGRTELISKADYAWPVWQLEREKTPLSSS